MHTTELYNVPYTNVFQINANMKAGLHISTQTLTENLLNNFETDNLAKLSTMT